MGTIESPARCVIHFSGGVASYMAAKRAVARYGKDNCLLVFCDTKSEDVDLYRFLIDTIVKLGVPWVHLCDGRDIWQVFTDERFLGNSRVDPCSKKLKRQISDRWMRKNYPPGSCVRVFGYDIWEQARIHTIRKWLPDYEIWCPMSEPPYMNKPEMLDATERDGIPVPFLYTIGAAHNNCGGSCVKAGKAHWAWFLTELPERYAIWERKEQEFRDTIRHDATILKDMTLKEFREHIQRGGEYDLFDTWNCGCFAESAA